jgi:hypothetical protein
MGLNTTERVSLIIRCDNPDCGQGIEKLLAWLITVNGMSCAHCGGAINLESGDNGLRIQKLAQACASIDASLSKLSESH